MFDDMMRDRITVRTKDGKEYSNVAASVQHNKIITLRTDIPIGPGDEIIRPIPAGLDEIFIVEDPGFLKGSPPIPDSYQMRVRRGERNAMASQMVIYNITGANARFNINSIDTSTNIINQAPSEMFKALRDAIRWGITNSEEREKLIAQTVAMQQEVGRVGFAKSYAHFIELAANHMQIMAPFLPALSQLLIGK